MIDGYEGRIFNGVRLDGKKGKFSLKFIYNGAITLLEFNNKQDAKEANARMKFAGIIARLISN